MRLVLSPPLPVRTIPPGFRVSASCTLCNIPQPAPVRKINNFIGIRLTKLPAPQTKEVPAGALLPRSSPRGHLLRSSYQLGMLALLRTDVDLDLNSPLSQLPFECGGTLRPVDLRREFIYYHFFQIDHNAGSRQFRDLDTSPVKTGPPSFKDVVLNPLLFHWLGLKTKASWQTSAIAPIVFACCRANN